MIGSKSQSNIEGLNYDELKKICDNKEELSYSKLCKRINIKELSGNSKIKQIRELSGICKFTKEKNKYKFEEICEKEIIDLFDNRSIYVPYIQILLSHIFDIKNIDSCYFTMSDLMVELGMINTNFKQLTGGEMKKYCSYISRENNFDSESFFKFVYKSYNSVLKPIVKNSLKSLQNKRVIDLINGYRVFKKVKYFEKEYILSEDTNIQKDLGKELFSIESEAMTNLDIKDIRELYGKKAYLKDSYYKECERILRFKSENDEKFIKNNWKYIGFCRNYFIFLNKKRLSHNFIEIKKEFNNIVINKLMETSTLDSLSKENIKLFITALIFLENEYDFKKDILKVKKEIEDLEKKLYELSYNQH